MCLAYSHSLLSLAVNLLTAVSFNASNFEIFFSSCDITVYKWTQLVMKAQKSVWKFHRYSGDCSFDANLSEEYFSEHEIFSDIGLRIMLLNLTTVITLLRPVGALMFSHFRWKALYLDISIRTKDTCSWTVWIFSRRLDNSCVGKRGTINFLMFFWASK